MGARSACLNGLLPVCMSACLIVCQPACICVCMCLYVFYAAVCFLLPLFGPVGLSVCMYARLPGRLYFVCMYLYACEFVCMYACMFVCVRIDVCMHTTLRAYRCESVCMYVFMYMISCVAVRPPDSVYVYMHVSLYVCVCMCAWIIACVYVPA